MFKKMVIRLLGYQFPITQLLLLLYGFSSLLFNRFIGKANRITFVLKFLKHCEAQRCIENPGYVRVYVW